MSLSQPRFEQLSNNFFAELLLFYKQLLFIIAEKRALFCAIPTLSNTEKLNDKKQLVTTKLLKIKSYFK